MKKQREFLRRSFCLAVRFGLTLAALSSMAQAASHVSQESDAIRSAHGIPVANHSPLPYDQAMLMLDLAAAAYKPTTAAVVPQILVDFDMKTIKARTGFGEGNEAEFGYVASRLNASGKLEVYIATRGTDTRDDVVTDGMVALTVMDPRFAGDKGANYLVHSGFNSAALSAQESIAEHLLALKKSHGKGFDDVKIYMTGHSLGGAMTALNAIWLSGSPDLAPNGVEKVVTFGAPSIGSAEVVSLLNAKVKNNLHIYQVMDPVVVLKASEDYSYFTNRMAIPTQDLLSDGLASHKLSGYRKSLMAKFGKAEHDVGYVTQFLDMPIVNGTLIGALNKLSHEGGEWIKKPQNQLYLLQQGFFYLSAVLSTVLNYALKNWSWREMFFL